MNAIADLLIRHKAIEFGDFTLASGAKSRYYVDVKSAVTDPGLLAAIGQEIADQYDFEVVAGVAVGGVPIAVATALAAGKPFTIIRAEEKDHGKKNPIIGEVKDKDVLLVEDVTTSGGSALYGITTLRSAGAVADRVVTVVDREQGASAALAKENICLFYLVKVSEIL